jgi:signal transduction histidine kinase
VRDHGPGIAPGEDEIIFERFKQGRPSPYVQRGGFGLGLYVVRQFVELMGGTVTAVNHPEGGAVFTCVLLDWDASEVAEG